MAKRIRITLEEDFDDELGYPTTVERVYELPEGLESLSEIEAAVEEIKRAALPQLEAELLSLAQERFVVREKRGPLAVQRQTHRNPQDASRLVRFSGAAVEERDRRGGGWRGGNELLPGPDRAVERRSFEPSPGRVLRLLQQPDELR